ncbi:hypothetical protein KAU34_08945 [candidate division WOR-3 bacterium]|nr:hypothetical protein [candidate division WOR-3 bacterium]
MEEISKLKLEIDKIGQQMVSCSNKCNGIACNLEEGILPRCLILEIDSHTQSGGVVIVGINPGHSKPYERNYYIKNGQSYDKVVEYWNAHIRKRKYYSSLRSFVNQLGFQGPILWTELVKCENMQEVRSPPLQTFRICTKTYLSRELDLIPDNSDNWPLIAVGREVYKALAYRFPTRIVVGIPHPTGSFGYFSKLFDRNGELLKIFKLPPEKLWDGKSGRAVWFDAKNGQIR